MFRVLIGNLLHDMPLCWVVLNTMWNSRHL